MEFSVPMALADFVPVVLFLIGAILLQRELYPRLGKGQFALFAAGTINVFCAGALKAVYKLLYALGVCDFTKLNEVFFPVQSIGFLLAGLAMAAFLFYKPKKMTVCGIAAAPAVYSGTALFVSLMVAGLGLLDAGDHRAACRVVCMQSLHGLSLLAGLFRRGDELDRRGREHRRAGDVPCRRRPSPEGRKRSRCRGVI